MIGPGGRPITAAPAPAAGGSSAHVKDSGLATFAADVLEASRTTPVIVDFWAPWCGPCKAMGPTVDALATEYQGKVKIGKLNTDENQQTAMRFGIRSIPTLLLFKGGKVVDQKVGAMPKPELIKMLTPHVAS